MTTLNLTLTEPGGGDLNDHVHIDVFDLANQNQYQAVGAVKREISLSGIEGAGNRTLRVVVSSANHRDVQALFFAGPDQVSVALVVPVDPDKVVRINAPAYAALAPQARLVLEQAAVPQFKAGSAFLTGNALYAALDSLPLLKACFLNISGKASAINFEDGTVLDRFGSLLDIRQDRIFVAVSQDLPTVTAHSNAFHAVDFSLHTPLPGFTTFASYKTFDHYGNLQLTFQRSDDGKTTVSDTDIDDAQGVEHIFQVVDNVFEGPTNPYNIHEILLEQTPPVDPDYDFVFATALTTG